MPLRVETAVPLRLSATLAGSVRRPHVRPMVECQPSQDARWVCENHPDKPWEVGMASAATPPACHAPTAMSCTTASGPLWLPISLLRLIGIRGQSTNTRAGSPRFPQPGVNRMPQEVVGGPGQIGDLGDKLRLDPMDTRKDERRSEARFLVRQDLQRRCLAG